MWNYPQVLFRSRGRVPTISRDFYSPGQASAGLLVVFMMDVNERQTKLWVERVNLAQ